MSFRNCKIFTITDNKVWLWSDSLTPERAGFTQIKTDSVNFCKTESREGIGPDWLERNIWWRLDVLAAVLALATSRGGRGWEGDFIIFWLSSENIITIIFCWKQAKLLQALISIIGGRYKQQSRCLIYANSDRSTSHNSPAKSQYRALLSLNYSWTLFWRLWSNLLSKAVVRLVLGKKTHVSRSSLFFWRKLRWEPSTGVVTAAAWNISNRNQEFVQMFSIHYLAEAGMGRRSLSLLISWLMESLRCLLAPLVDLFDVS